MNDDHVDGGGLRYNDNKLRLDLLPVGPLQDLAKVLAQGAQKYAERNWERGMRWSTCYGCALRHLFAWQGGEDLDQESGLPHLAHVMANIAFLLEYRKTCPALDDRPHNKEQRIVDDAATIAMVRNMTPHEHFENPYEGEADHANHS